MNGMWARWARQRLLSGLGFLGATAVTTVAVVLFWGDGFAVLVCGMVWAGLFTLAVAEISTGIRYARLAHPNRRLRKGARS